MILLLPLCAFDLFPTCFVPGHNLFMCLIFDPKKIVETYYFTAGKTLFTFIRIARSLKVSYLLRMISFYVNVPYFCLFIKFQEANCCLPNIIN